MSEPLPSGLDRVRALLLDDVALVSAVASGRRRGIEPPPWPRVEFRYVDLRAGRHLQVVRREGAQAHTANHPVGAEASEAVDAMLAGAFGNWHVETRTGRLQLRVTKRGEAQVHTSTHPASAPVEHGHDRERERLIPEDDPVLVALGISDREGRVKPTRRAKYRQVEEFVRHLDATVTEAMANGALRTPTPDDPWRVVDLGCGNAYLGFAAHRHLARRGLPARLIGVDVKAQSREHNRALAFGLGLGPDEADFVVGSIAEAALPDLPGGPDVVLALHACDTATDEALARALAWEAPVVLAAPCCHHDVAAQLRAAPTPAPYALLTRHGILRERFADTLTDALRAAILRGRGYRVEVVEFVGSEHTPRNTLLRCVRTGRSGDEQVRRDYADLLAIWRVRPALATMLDADGVPGFDVVPGEAR